MYSKCRSLRTREKYLPPKSLFQPSNSNRKIQKSNQIKPGFNSYLKEFFPKKKISKPKSERKRSLLQSQRRGSQDFCQTMTPVQPKIVETPNLPLVHQPRNLPPGSQNYDPKTFCNSDKFFIAKKKVGNFIKTFNAPVKINHNKKSKRVTEELKVRTLVCDPETHKLTQFHSNCTASLHTPNKLKTTPFTNIKPVRSMPKPGLYLKKRGGKTVSSKASYNATPKPSSPKMKPTNMDKFNKVMSFKLSNKLDDMMDKVTRLKRTLKGAQRGRNNSTNCRERKTGILIKDDFIKQMRSPNVRVTFNLPDED
ncbi:unnamed protein product [Moneuplotes crassus]|uniref:Uncharacterized protein n=1 Tax=Euplotes crassus TaxID=5936 RepID=A0AAD1ULS8_EUPCR|nr:unnamed protein product [Moneuplotes crassus]